MSHLYLIDKYERVPGVPVAGPGHGRCQVQPAMQCATHVGDALATLGVTPDWDIEESGDGVTSAKSPDGTKQYVARRSDPVDEPKPIYAWTSKGHAYGFQGDPNDGLHDNTARDCLAKGFIVRVDEGAS